VRAEDRKERDVKKRVFLSLLVLTLLFGAQILMAAGQGDAAEAKVKPKVISYLSVWAEDDPNNTMLLSLTDDFMKENPGRIERIDFDYLISGEVVQKMQILVASNDVPDWWAYGAGTVLENLIDIGVPVNVEEKFTKLGLMDYLEEGAVSLLKGLVNGKGLYCIPMGWNVEGIWYNKNIYEEYDLSVPETWAELEENAAKLMEAGVQPFAVAGKEQWPITRHINMLVMRNVGWDAMTKAGDGEISFMQQGFFDAAKTIQDWAAAGWFGRGVNTLDYGTARDVFTTGEAAMFYMGSWFLSNLNDPEINKIGPKEVGYFNFPATEYGKGTTDDYSVNAGAIVTFKDESWDEVMDDWAKFVVPKVGDFTMDNYGAFKGFTVENPPATMPYYTQMVLDIMGDVVNGGLWFEAKMDEKTGSIAKTNGQSLILGEITPEEFWQEIQDATDEYLESKK
jgi:raffinose/stachyose/melibiose transport system substrate-binding protein